MLETKPGFVRVIENLDLELNFGISFPGLESHGKLCLLKSTN